LHADPADGANDKELTRARDLLHKAARSPAGSFATICANARLPARSVEVFALAVSCELSSTHQQLLDRLQGHSGSRPTLFTIARLLGDFSECAVTLGSGSPLRAAGLVELVEDGPWSQHGVVVPPAVMWALCGDPQPDPGLPPGTTTVTTDEPGGLPLVHVSGRDRARRLQAASQYTAGTRFVVVEPGDDAAEWSAVVREATLSGAGVIVEVDGTVSQMCRSWIERAAHLSWAIVSPVEVPVRQMPDRPWREYEADDSLPSDDEWSAALGDEVARTHPLTAEQLDTVGRVLPARGGDLDAAVRRLLAGPLDRLARRVRPRRSWNDIVVSPDRLSLLRGIAVRYRKAATVYDEWGFDAIPSRGVVALFSGPSGTGKTLAAEIIAGELGLDLFKLDLSAIVSKYIGETEKNLDALFEAAGVGNVVLFFDEADALFGKRSEVREAKDRFANIEVSYLLQRLESYDGIVVMATNFEKNIDDAFVRRIHTRIEFTVPGPDERVAIWQRQIPKGAPVDDLDLEWLAGRFELAGGPIRNAALQGAFLAAEANEPIGMRHLVAGVAHEFRKQGRIVHRDDFAPHFDALAGTDG
jgi:hypothetical protein